MSTIIQNSAIVFPDITTQTTAGMPLTGGQFTSNTPMPSIQVMNGDSGLGYDSQSRIRQYTHSYNVPANTASSVDLMANLGSYGDPPFYLSIWSYFGGHSYQSWMGHFGGYGAYFNDAGSTAPTFTLNNINTSSGYSKLNLSRPSYVNLTNVYIHMIIYGNQDIAALNGTIYQ